ncbi:AI-2E family transporter [Glutamicibacter protophormiae]|uniref:PurR-regulated permease PerM n=1 Tax=Glutamicibacter protophormiae TaxID=37930 RepID=A0ABS4XSN1_GLUPR|nr:AI-2E family transporter [Glutamicibacter protophormiae]MBP2399514.1 putative PurR-regulated permease PerM [Glutamicibacter protophormiae]
MSMDSRVPGHRGRRTFTFRSFPKNLTVVPGQPFATGFVMAAGALLAVGLAMVVVSMSSVLMSITLALFLALGMTPAVNALKGRGMPHGWSVLTVIAAFVLLMVGVAALVVPAIVRQFTEFLASIPQEIDAIQASSWYTELSESMGFSASEQLLAAFETYFTAENLLMLSGGVLHVGIGIVNGISSAFLVIVLTLYFVSTLDPMKKAVARLVPAYRREKFSETLNSIVFAVGRSVAGAVTLSAINASVVLVIFLLLGSQVAVLFALVAFLITLIPMIGSVLFLCIGTLGALLMSPTSALIFLVVYFIYVQLEAYQVTPRIMGKAVNVPGVLVIIAAMTGAALLGLFGALLAIPITASILIIVREIVIPKRDAQTEPPT